MQLEILLVSAVIITFVSADGNKIECSCPGAERNIKASAAVCEKFPNEEFAIDLRRCQNTCEFYGRKWNCPDSYYKPKGDCYCKAGFARLTENGKCVSVTKNKNCAAKLPITEDSCTEPNESYYQSVRMGICDTNCLTYGCVLDHTPETEYSWGPNCDCKNSNFRRLNNGTCVHFTDEPCIAEYLPSPERCAAVGQIYKTNAPCQPACYGLQYCPLAAGSCVCTANKFAFTYRVEKRVLVHYFDEQSQTEYSQHESQLITQMLACYHHEANCPITTTSSEG